MSNLKELIKKRNEAKEQFDIALKDLRRNLPICLGRLENMTKAVEYRGNELDMIEKQIKKTIGGRKNGSA